MNSGAKVFVAFLLFLTLLVFWQWHREHPGAVEALFEWPTGDTGTQRPTAKWPPTQRQLTLQDSVQEIIDGIQAANSLNYNISVARHYRLRCNAEVYGDMGDIRIGFSPSLWNSMNKWKRAFVLSHEIGHVKCRCDSQTEADRIGLELFSRWVVANNIIEMNGDVNAMSANALRAVDGCMGRPSPEIEARAAIMLRLPMPQGYTIPQGFGIHCETYRLGQPEPTE